MGLSRPSKWRCWSITDCGTVDPAYWSATMSPGTARMMTKVRIATPTSVGIMSKSRPMTYRRIRLVSGGSRWAANPSLLREPDGLEVLVGVVVRADAPAAHYVEVGDDPVPPEHRVLVSLRVHRVLLDPRDEGLALRRVGLAALRVDHLVEVGIVVIREVEALAEPRCRPELRELQVGLVQEVAVEVERHLEVARAQVRLVRGGLLHIVCRADAHLLPLVDDEERHRLVRRGDVAVEELEAQVRHARVGEQLLRLGFRGRAVGAVSADLLKVRVGLRER